MAGPIRVTLFLKAGKYGASESYINSAATFEAVAGQIPKGTFGWAKDSVLDKLIKVRMAMCTGDVSLGKVRMNDVSTPGKMTVRYPASETTGNIFAVIGSTNETPTTDWTSLLVLMETDGNKRANKYLYGVPDGIRGYDDQYLSNGTPGFGDKFAKWATLIADGSWQIQSRPPLSSPLNTVITSFVVAANGKSALVGPMVSPEPIPGSKKWLIVIRGLKGPAGWNGVHEASDAGDGKMLIGPSLKTRPSTPAFSSVPGQVVSLYGANFSTVTLAGPVRVCERDRGRPFDSPVGRRRTV